MKRYTVLSVLALAGCVSYGPIATDDVLVQIDFERGLDSTGSASISGQSYDGEPDFRSGKRGDALYSLGDGRWVAYEAATTISTINTVEISFDFRRADWVNPYKGGAGIQTAIAISSASPTKIEHIVFNVGNGTNPNLQISIEDENGNRHRLHTQQGFAESDWHNVKLQINKDVNETLLYFDEVRVDSVNAIPTVIQNGIDRIIFGTWYKKNQAYRGEIDNFLIVEKHSS